MGRHIRLLISPLQYIRNARTTPRARGCASVPDRDEQILDSYRCLHIIIWRVDGMSGEKAFWFYLFDLLVPVMIILRATRSQCRFWTST